MHKYLIAAIIAIVIGLIFCSIALFAHPEKKIAISLGVVGVALVLAGGGTMMAKYSQWAH